MLCCAKQFAYDIIEPQQEPPSMNSSVPDIYNIRYNVPKKTEMAVCMVIFNPSNSKRMIMNYFYILEKLKLAGIPTFTIELVFEDRHYEIQNAFHVRTDSHMFHKERLCRLLEKRIPSKYTKLCFIDADVLFDNPNWYDETSSLLNTHEIVQPFSMASWLDLTYKTSTMERLSIVFMDRNSRFNSSYHPGFAWAFQRPWYNRVGFYEIAITGSGDTMSAAAWIGVDFPAGYLKNAYAASFEDYKKKLTVLPKICSTSGKLYHLWHGNRANRKYVSRHECVNDITDIRDVLATNKDDVFELTNRKLNADMKRYFDEREDDGLS
jgi:hypothetical protein